MLVVSAGAFQAARLLVYLVWIGAVGIWLVLMLRTFKGETWRVPLADSPTGSLRATASRAQVDPI